MPKPDAAMLCVVDSLLRLGRIVAVYSVLGRKIQCKSF